MGPSSVIQSAGYNNPLTLKAFELDYQYQIWSVIPYDDNYFAIGVSPDPEGFVFDVKGGKTVPGTVVQTYEYNKGDNQLWKAVAPTFGQGLSLPVEGQLSRRRSLD